MNAIYRDELRAALLLMSPNFRLSGNGRNVTDDRGVTITSTECLTVEEVVARVAKAYGLRAPSRLSDGVWIAEGGTA